MATAGADDIAIELQQYTLRRFAAEQGYEDCDVYIDNGVAGATLDRPALNRLSADIRSGMIQAVFARCVSRIGRNLDQVIEWLGMAKKHGVQVFTPDGVLPPDDL